MTSLPKITLITIVRNGAAFIERCLQSVVNQQYDNLEYIVLDAASTDGTQEIIGRYLSHISFFRSEPDNGPYNAILQGYKMAKGDIVGLLMADDWLEAGALQTLAEMYLAKPEAQIFCFAMQEYKQAGEQLIATRSFCDPAGEVFTLEDGLYCQGINRFYARSLLETEAYYTNDVYPNLADREFYVRLGHKHVCKAWTDKVLYNFLTHPGSNSTGGSAEKVVRFLDETARMAEDQLHREGLTAQERGLLKNWYCFNMIRSIAFRLKAGKWGGAMRGACGLLVRYPWRVVRNVVCWKMPEPYRAKPPV